MAFLGQQGDQSKDAVGSERTRQLATPRAALELVLRVALAMSLCFLSARMSSRTVLSWWLLPEADGVVLRGHWRQTGETGPGGLGETRVGSYFSFGFPDRSVPTPPPPSSAGQHKVT